MARIHVFTDEAGNFDFSARSGASRYFVVTTVTMADFRAGDSLLSLRRQLAWEGHPQASPDFHATEELQSVRDRVFEELARWDYRVDSTVINKAAVSQELSRDEVEFYGWAWFNHFDRVSPSLVAPGDELLVMGASLGTRKRRSAFHRGIERALEQALPAVPFRTVSWSAASDPCLWVVDFCCWAIQRRWERADDRSHRLISHQISSEVEVQA